MVFLLASCAWLNNPGLEKEKTPTIIPIKTIINNLVHEESSGYHTMRGKVVVSHKGAIGRFQITAPALEDYNKYSRGKKYTLQSLYNARINKIVGIWYLNRFIDYYWRRGFIYSDTIMLAINTYNQGITNTARGKIYYPYVSNICPEYFVYFINRREITNQGTKIMKIKSLYPNQTNI